MKTYIKNLIASTLSLVILAGITTSAKADSGLTVLNNVKKVNKVNVAGNVNLILVQSADEHVKVYDSYYEKNALVQEKDGELRISSYEKQPLTVVVYTSNISAISASDNATVSTYGKLSVLDLDVTLNDQATAVLNTNTITLNTTVKGNADLTLAGNSLDYNAVVNNISKINMTAFSAANVNLQSQNAIPAYNNLLNSAIAE